MYESGSFFELLHDVFASDENGLLFFQLFPGELIHVFDSVPVHFYFIFKLLNTRSYFFVDGLKFSLYIFLKHIKMGFYLVNLKLKILGVFDGLLEDLVHVGYLNVEC